MVFELKPLPYKYDALEPHIDKMTMQVHHDKHHQGYTDKLNLAIEKHPEFFKKSVENILKNLDKIPEDIRQVVIDNGGGFYNHNFFWKILKKDVEPKGEILKEIEKKFGSFENFKKEFANSAITLFGSGWTWLVINKGNLEIVQTKNQDAPISKNYVPILGVDVWEHAYYLKYQNRRAEYLENFFKIINWDEVNKLFLAASK